MTALRFGLFVAAALATASCRQAPETAPLNEQPAADAAADAPAASIDDSLALDQLAGARNHMAAPQGYGALPPDDRALRFVGRWAANVNACESAAWRFGADRLETPAGSVCTFGDVTPVEGGFDIAARCTAEGPERDDTIRLRFDEEAGRLRFESESLAGDALVYCGPETPQP